MPIPSFDNDTFPDVFWTTLEEKMASQPNSLADRTVVISGASRGIGLAIGVGAARQGAQGVRRARCS
jgi:hypothetical protein